MRTYHSAWNKGRLLGQKPPLKPKEIWSLRIRLQLAEKTRTVRYLGIEVDDALEISEQIEIESTSGRRGKRRNGLLIQSRRRRGNRGSPERSCA